MSVCDELMNPSAVICAEPLIVPAGVLSPLSLTNPNAVIWAEPLTNPPGTDVISVKSTDPLDVKYEPVAASIFVNLPSVEDVYEFNDVMSVLSLMNPNEVIWPDPLTNVGTFVKFE